MDELIYDIFNVIAGYLPINDVHSIRQTSSMFSKHVTKYRIRLRKYHNYILGPGQVKAVSYITDNKGILNICAPMSYGKTAIGLATCFGPKITDEILKWKDRTLILAPPKAIRTWIDELESIFGFNTVYKRKDPVNSQVLILIASVNKIHMDYYNNITDKTKLNNRVFITSTTKPYNPRYYRDYIKIIQNIGTIIVDEAHTGESWIKVVITRDPRTKRGNGITLVLLSASPVFIKNPCTKKQIQIKKLNLSYTLIEEKLPTIIPNNIFINVGKTTIYGKSNDMERDIRIYKNAISSILQNDHKKIVLLFPAVECYTRRLNPMATDLAGIHKIECTTFCRATSRLETFHNKTKKALLISTVSYTSEAINLHADALIIVRPEWINVERYKQTIGRVIRTSNPYKQVTCYNICSSAVNSSIHIYSRLAYGLHHDFPWKPDSKKEECRYRLSLLEAWGYNIKELKHIDILVGLYAPILQAGKAYNLWKNVNEKTIQEKDIKTLLCIKY